MISLSYIFIEKKKCLIQFNAQNVSQHNFKWKKERMKKKFWGVIWGCDMSPYLPREIWILTNFELIQVSQHNFKWKKERMKKNSGV